MTIKRALPSSLATNSSKSNDGWSAQCRSSNTSTKGCRLPALLRNAVMESNSLKRACSGLLRLKLERRFQAG